MKTKIVLLILVTVLGALAFLYLDKELKPVIVVIWVVITSFFGIKDLLKKDGEYQKNLLLMGGLGVTIISWFMIGYINNVNEKNRSQLNINQSILQSKRDLKIRYLLDAYFRLSNSDRRDAVPPGNQLIHYDYIYLKYNESALMSIQLLGNESTVKWANLYTMSGGKEHFADLLLALRGELRSELDLKELPATKEFQPTIFRTYRKINAPDTLTLEQQYQLIIKLNEFDRGLIK